MPYLEEIQIEDRIYTLEFRNQINSEHELLFITKDGEVCDNWSESYQQDLQIILQHACDWINLEKPKSFCTTTASLEIFDFYKSNFDQIRDNYICSDRTIHFPIKYYTSYYDRI